MLDNPPEAGVGEYTFRTRPNTQEEALIWITALKAKSKSTWSINNTRKATLSVLFKVSKVLTTGSLRWAWCIGLGNYAVAEPNPVHPPTRCKQSLYVLRYSGPKYGIQLSL